jgi:hypothetical protein
MHSVLSEPSVASRTELPQMMIQVLVLRHTPFRARHASEKAWTLPSHPRSPFDWNSRMTPSRRFFTAVKSGSLWITKSRPVGAFFPNGFSPRKLLRIVQLKSFPGQICFWGPFPHAISTTRAACSSICAGVIFPHCLGADG